MKSSTISLAMIGFASLATIAIAADTAKSEKNPKELSRDEVHIAVQRICPVTGSRLGSHGEPVKAKIGEEAIYLCCEGCISGKVDPKHWATIHANFAKAQGICPVMKNELPENPKWRIVNGQIIYVCCEPCLEKIDADAETYLKAVDQLYRTSLNPKKEGD